MRIYRSRQGSYRRSEAPIRYWFHTVVVAAATGLAIYFLVDQAVLVIMQR